MTSSGGCSWLRRSDRDNLCALRRQNIPAQEVTLKCTNPDLSIICIDAYSSLFKAHELIEQKSTEAFLWLVEAGTQFENLNELDNTIMACIKGINVAKSMNLLDNGYEMFKYARRVYEDGLARSDPSVADPSIKHTLFKAGLELITSARKSLQSDTLRDMQAELKAAVLEGTTLKKVEREESEKGLVIVDGRQLYAKKLREYKESAEAYLRAGVLSNAVVFSCMAALAELMLGRPKEGIEYLTSMASDPKIKGKFNEDECFKWTRLIFKGFVSNDAAAIDEAKTRFLRIPWSFKDDRDFARRIMDSVARRVSLQRESAQ